MKARFFRSGLALLPLILGGGCSGSGGLTKVDGVVTLDGKPLPSALVKFFPEDGGVQASGVTGTDGTFRLTTYSTGDGAKPGMYKVTIAVSEAGSDVPQADPNDPKNMMEAMRKHMEKNKGKPQAKKSSVPANYTDVSKTPLKQKVPPDGKVTIDLKSTGS